jgi:LPXTG-site transpeptidase (sortase) family protein
MRHRIAILGLATGLLLAACSSASPAANDTAVSTPTSTSPTSTTIAADDPAPTTTPARSPLAELVTPVGSAQYDPADHIDDRPVPTSITIEGIGITAASVVDVGVEDNGDMEIPGADGVGWYRFNATPGEPGSAVLAAHISFDGQPGVFRYLDEASVGDRVVIQFDDGTTSEFEIIELAQYDKQELPTDRVFAKTGDPVLTLITCGGDFNRSLRSYEDNVVAYAIPIGD